MKQFGTLLTIVPLLVLTSAAPSNPLAVIEKEPILQGANCQFPMRVRNLTSKSISVTVTKTWKQVGPGCNVLGSTTTEPPIGLGPNGSSPLGCSILFTSGSMCTDHSSWRYVSALERIVVEQKPQASEPQEWGRSRNDTGGPPR